MKYHLINDILLGIPFKDTKIYCEERDDLFNDIGMFYYSEDWYIIYDKDNNVIEEFVIERDSKKYAIEEMEQVKQYMLLGGKVL